MENSQNNNNNKNQKLVVIITILLIVVLIILLLLKGCTKKNTNNEELLTLARKIWVQSKIQYRSDEIYSFGSNCYDARTLKIEELKDYQTFKVLMDEEGNPILIILVDQKVKEEATGSSFESIITMPTKKEKVSCEIKQEKIAVNFDLGKKRKTESSNTNYETLSVKIRPKSSGNTKIISTKYCITTGDVCEPNIELDPEEDEVSIPSNEEDQKVCVTVEDENGNCSTVFCSGTYHVEQTNPALTIEVDSSTKENDEWYTSLSLKASVTELYANDVKGVKYCTTSSSECIPNTFIEGPSATVKFRSNKYGQKACFLAVDEGNNNSETICSETYLVDETKPTFTKKVYSVITGTNDWYNDLTYEINAVDEHSKIGEIRYCTTSLDTCVPATVSYSTLISFKSDKNPQRMCIVVKDKAGNNSNIECSDLYKINKTIPTISIEDSEELKGENDWYYKKEFKLIPSSDITTIKEVKYCYTTEETCIPNEKVELDNLKVELINNSKPIKLCVNTTDESSLTSKVVCSKAYKVDNTYSTNEIKVNKSIEGTNNWNKELSFKISGENKYSGIDNIKYCITTSETCTPDTLLNDDIINIKSNKEKQKVCSIITSNNGLSSEKVCSEAYKVDVDLPTNNIDISSYKLGKNDWYTSLSLKLTSEDDTSGVYGIKYCITTDETCNPSVFVEDSEAEVTLSSNSKPQKLCLYSIDNAGNESNLTCSKLFKVDLSTPSVEFSKANESAGENGWYKKLDILVKPKAKISGEDKTLYCITTNNTCDPVTLIEDNYYIPLLTNKNASKVCAKTTSKAGVESEVSCSNAYNIDNQKPTVTQAVGINTEGTNDWYTSLNINLSLTDDESGPSYIKYCLTTSETCTPNEVKEGVSAVVEFNSSKDYQKTCYIGVDKTGNESDIACSGLFKVDKSTPTLLISEVDKVEGENGWDKNISLVITPSSSASNVVNAKYCVTTESVCEPNIEINKEATVTLGNNPKAQKVCFTVKNDAGTESGIVCGDTYKVDNKAPTGSLSIDSSSINADTWYSKLLFNVESSDEDSKVNEIKYCVTTNNSCEPAIVLQDKIEVLGNKEKQKVCINVKDYAGNISTTKCSNEYLVDMSLPTVNIYEVEANKLENDWYSKVSLKLESNSEISGVKESKYCITTDNMCEPSTTFNLEKTISLSNNPKAQKVCVESINNANLSSGITCSETYKVDNTNPSVDLNIKSSTLKENNWYTSLSFEVISSDDDSKISKEYYCITTNNTCEPINEVEGVIEFTSNVSPQKVCVNSKDNAGNISSTKCSNEYLVDTSLPQTTIAEPIKELGLNDWYKSLAIRIIPTPTVSGIKTTKYCVTEETACTPNIEIGSQEVDLNFESYDKQRKICVSAVNNAGSESGIVCTNNYKVDGISPSLDITGNDIVAGENGWYTKVLFSLTGEDAHSKVLGYKYCLTENLTCETDQFIEGSSALLNIPSNLVPTKVCVEGVDFAGNISEKKCSNSYKVDTTTPEINVSEGSTTAKENGWYSNVAINTTPSSSYSDIDHTNYCITTNETCNPTTLVENNSITLPSNSESRKVCVQTFNKSGTPSEVKCSNSYKVDNILPTLSVNVLSKTDGENGWYKSLSLKTTGEDSDSGIRGYNYCVTTSDTCEPNEFVNGSTLERAFTSNANAQKMCFNIVDNAGNKSSTICSESYKVDATTPNVIVNINNSTSNADNSWYYTIGLKVNATSIVDINEIKYCTTSSSTCTPNTIYTPDSVIELSNSSSAQKICASAKSTSGNTSNVTCSNSYSVDSNKPNASITIPSYTAGSNNWYKSLSLKANVSNNYSPIKNIKYCITTSDTCEPTTLFSGTNDTLSLASSKESQKMCVNITTKNDLTSDTVCSDKYLVDIDNPTITTGVTHIALSNGWYSTVSINGKPVDETSGVNNVKYCVTSSSTCTPNLDTTDYVVKIEPSASARKVCYLVKDNAGRTSDVTCSQTYKVDNTAPTVSSVTDGGGYIKVSASDTYSGLSSYCVNQSDTSTTSCSWISNTSESFNTGNLSSDGTYYVHVKDAAGNIGHSSSVYVTVFTASYSFYSSTYGRVNVSVNSASETGYKVKYASGAKSDSYFLTSGTDITSSKYFSVSNGTYTVALVNKASTKAIAKTIYVANVSSNSSSSSKTLSKSVSLSGYSSTSQAFTTNGNASAYFSGSTLYLSSSSVSYYDYDRDYVCYEYDEYCSDYYCPDGGYLSGSKCKGEDYYLENPTCYCEFTNGTITKSGCYDSDWGCDDGYTRDRSYTYYETQNSSHYNTTGTTVKSSCQEVIDNGWITAWTGTKDVIGYGYCEWDGDYRATCDEWEEECIDDGYEYTYYFETTIGTVIS